MAGEVVLVSREGIMGDDLEKRVEELEKQVGFLRQLVNELIDRIKSAGGYLVNVGKSKGDDENKQ
jgi:hypothetical protein